MTDEGTAGGAEGPPTTARLQRVLDRAERVVIVEAPPDQADSTEAARTEIAGAEIADLARLLAIVDGGTGDNCRCRGWPTILVHAPRGELIARWTLHHQTGIRGVGDCDADLRDGPALTDWLAERGLTRSREVQAELAVQETESERRRMRWVRAAPTGLAEAAEAVAHPSDGDLEAWSRRLQEAEARLAALTRHCLPDGIERVRALLEWAGLPARESSGGLMWYDLAVQRLLLAEPADLVLTALAAHPPSPVQLDGAAQLFASVEWTTAHGMRLPQTVRSMLIEHIQADGTDAMRFRMDHGYYAAGQAG